MTLVYAKIINMCGAGPGTGGWGQGGGQGGLKGQKGGLHIHSCLICLGSIHMYIMTSRTPIFVKNKILDLDPWALDPQSPPNL